MRSVSCLRGLALLGLGALPCIVWAGTPTSPLAPERPVPAATSIAAPHAADPIDGMGKRVDTSTLARLSGGTDVTNQMTLNGTVSDNQNDHVVTGFNSISADSFSGAAGVPMVIQNTGNSVLIQNATIINVQFQP